MGISSKLSRHLLDLEIKYYMMYLETIDTGIQLLDNLSKLKKPIFLYTDTYHSLSTINSILQIYLKDYCFADIIVSSDFGFSKDNVDFNMFKEHQKRVRE